MTTLIVIMVIIEILMMITTKRIRIRMTTIIVITIMVVMMMIMIIVVMMMIMMMMMMMMILMMITNNTNDGNVNYHACPCVSHRFKYFSITCAIYSLIFIHNLNFSTKGMVSLLPMLLLSMTLQCCNNSICDVTIGHTLGRP